MAGETSAAAGFGRFLTLVGLILLLLSAYRRGQFMLCACIYL